LRTKNNIMERVISRKSINSANDQIIRGEARNVSMDSKNVSMKCHTSFGQKNIVIAREKIACAASSALKRALK